MVKGKANEFPYNYPAIAVNMWEGDPSRMSIYIFNGPPALELCGEKQILMRFADDDQVYEFESNTGK